MENETSGSALRSYLSFAGVIGAILAFGGIGMAILATTATGAGDSSDYKAGMLLAVMLLAGAILVTLRVLTRVADYIG
jgi:hypothetical protein